MVLSRAGHEAVCAEVVDGTVGPGLAGHVGQSADCRARRDVDGMGLGEAQGTGRVDVDLLATGDFDVLIVLLDSEGWWMVDGG